ALTLATGASTGGVLASSRKLARVSNQVVGGLGMSTAAEFSRMYGAGEITRARALILSTTQRAFWIAVCFLPFMTVVGPPLYHFWTKTKTIDLWSLTAMLLAAVFNSIWSPLATGLLSINRTAKASTAYALTMFGCCVATFFVAQRFGIEGAATLMAAAEVAMIMVIVPTGCQLLEMKPTTFLREAVRAPDTLKAWLARNHKG
ncbi:MAG: hypothetical protein KF812_12215, partial [Fimbriimonadaceae bacterium]|nr:hypothetical protein [Fimbriimonadaceae bacterium]